jgi:L-rhamnose mutarotase
VQRVCFLLKVRKDRLQEYRLRHEKVWAEMQEALTAAGWHNYSLFLREDGLLVGYLETEDYDRARELMDTAEVNTRWQQYMADCFEREEGDVPHGAAHPLAEVFHLA